MSYTKITTSFKDHETVLTAAHLQHLENGIADNDAALVNRVRTDTNAQSLGTSQKRNARTNIDAPSTAEMTAAVAAEADLRSAADAAMETKTDGIQGEVDQAKEDITDLHSVSSSMVKTKTVAGNHLTIKDALAGKAKKLVVNLEPMQNKNGYSKPWIGGFGKNLASPVTDSNGWSINVGGSFSVNGDILAVETTAAVSSGVYAKSGSTLRNILTSLSGQYTWSIDVKASASISAAIGVQGIAMRNNVTVGTSWARISGTGTFNATSVPFVIYNNGSITATIEARNLQIEASSTATDYEPYENVCPIEGYDSVLVTINGYNLYDKEDVVIGKNWLNGVAANRALAVIPTEKGKALTIRADQVGSDRRVVIVGTNVFGSTATQSFNKGFQAGLTTKQYTVEADNYCLVQFERVDGGTVTQEDIDSWHIIVSYEDAKALTIPISASAGGPVYSGTATINEDGTGSLVIDRACVTLNLGASELQYSTNTKTFYFTTDIAPGMKVKQYTEAFTGLCDRFESYPGAPAWNTVTKPYIGFGPTMNVRFSIPGVTAPATALQYINGCQVCYELETPLSFTLTLEQISTLLGENHIWTDGKEIELTYQAEKYGKVDRLLSAFPVRSAGPADIIAFDDGADDIPVQALTVAIEPKQDLKGYGHPWIGGVGKNLLGGFAESTIYGVTIKETDQGILINGAMTAGQTQFSVVLLDKVLPSGTYVIKGVEGTGGSSYQLTITGGGMSSTRYGATNNTTFTSDGTTAIVIRLFVYSAGSPFNNIIVPWQVEAGTTATDYEPYENICPISGFNSLTVTRRGKNLLPSNDIVVWQNGSINTSGNNFSSDYGIRMADYLPINPDTDYTFSAYGQSDDCALFCYDADYNLLYRFQLWSINNGNGRYATFTTPSKTAYYKVRLTGSDYRPDRTMNMQLELGSTATAFEAYQETAFDVSLEKAGTVYGGTLNVLTGELTVDRGITTLADKTFANKQGSILPAGGYVVINGFSEWISASKAIVSDMLQGTVFADRGADGTISPLNSSSSAVNSLALFTKKTKEEAITAYKDATICYPLATPITYQLTPHEVATLLGGNTFSCDSGKVSLEYHADPSIVINKLLAAITAYGITV